MSRIVVTGPVPAPAIDHLRASGAEVVVGSGEFMGCQAVAEAVASCRLYCMHGDVRTLSFIKPSQNAR